MILDQRHPRHDDRRLWPDRARARSILEDDRIAWVGPAADLPRTDLPTHDLAGPPGHPRPDRLPHPHRLRRRPRRANSRCACNGASYEEVARAGGGILSTVTATRAASEDELFAAGPRPRSTPMLAGGAATVEIKSGYGLDIETELRMLRVARRLGAARARVRSAPPSSAPTPCRPNTRAAPTPTSTERVHPRPRTPPMPKAWSTLSTPSAKASPSRRDQVDRLFTEARRLGLPVKLHAEQLSNLDGAALAARHGALSADHLEYLDEDGVARHGRRRHRRRDPARRLLHPARNASAAHRRCCASTACRWRSRPTATPAPRP